VPAPKQHNSGEENETIKEGETPEDWKSKPAKNRQKDKDARNIFIQDLAPGRGFMITRHGLFEAAVGAVAFESSGALAAPAASTAGQDDALLWLGSRPCCLPAPAPRRLSKLLPTKNR
jgi:isoaspartyl peptidase/L-asparaginase-like protein (Ntn-hydrolase superfamily)